MKKPDRTYILEEDEHLQNLRKIIKRDFFQTKNHSQQKEQTIQLSLNDYLANFKSNQNKVFSELIELDKQKWRNDHWWFDKQDKLLMIQNSKLKPNQRQYQNMIENDKNVNGVTKAITLQQAKNSIFFNRDKNFGSYLNEQYEKAKKVNYQNCRLDSQKQSKQKITIHNNQQKDDSDEQNNQEVIMTWGQVEGTPLRLNPNDSYRIPQTPNRDLVLDKLNQKIQRQKKEVVKSSDKKSQLLMKIMGSAIPKSSYQKSSYLRNKNNYPSSVRQQNSKPITTNSFKYQKTSKKREQKEDIMQGLLNFQKKT